MEALYGCDRIDEKIGRIFQMDLYSINGLIQNATQSYLDPVSGSMLIQI